MNWVFLIFAEIEDWSTVWCFCNLFVKLLCGLEMWFSWICFFLFFGFFFFGCNGCYCSNRTINKWLPFHTYIYIYIFFFLFCVRMIGLKTEVERNDFVDNRLCLGHGFAYWIVSNSGSHGFQEPYWKEAAMGFDHLVLVYLLNLLLKKQMNIISLMAFKFWDCRLVSHALFLVHHT